MVDPATMGIASAVTQGAVDYIRTHIQESDNPEGKWEEAAEVCVVEVKVILRQDFKDNPGFDRNDLKEKIGNVGYSAEELAVRGEIHGFDEQLTELIGEFASVCADYANSFNKIGMDPEEEFQTQSNKVGDEIIEHTT